jgi:hypothetical protein
MWRAILRNVRSASRGEALCLAAGLSGLAMALGVTVAQATLAPVILSADGIRAAAAQADGPLCPDGWAAEHAARLGLSEAEMTAWYLREAMTLPDHAVMVTAGMVLTQIDPDGPIDDHAAARHQIMLCVAESRRMTQPAESLIPPELRKA